MSGPFKKLLDSFVEGEATPGVMLRAFRKREGFTLKKMEELTGIRESNLSALENDKIAMTKRYADLFAEVLKVDPTVFLYPNGRYEENRKASDALSELFVLPEKVKPQSRSDVVKKLWAYIKKNQLNEFKKSDDKPIDDKTIRKLARQTHHLKKSTKKAASTRRKAK